MRSRDSIRWNPLGSVSGNNRALRTAFSMFAIACTLYLVAPTLAQVRQNGRDEAQSTEMPTPSADQTAEDVLRALQQSRPPNDILQPFENTGSSVSHRGHLLPEGASVVNRRGWVERVSDGWVFVSEDAEGHPNLSLLPNAMAEQTIRTAAGATDTIMFEVSGEVTVFRRANHLLLRSAHRVKRESKSTDSKSPSALPQSEPDKTKLEPPSAEDVLAALRAERPAIVEVAAPTNEPRPDGNTRADLLAGLGEFDRATQDNQAEMRRTLRPDGTFLERRTGRFVEQGPHWMFVADSDQPDAAEPPWELLPCQATEFMLNLWSRDAHGLVFVVSGELTLFDGKNYLLPRLAMRRLASDNLRK